MLAFVIGKRSSMSLLMIDQQRLLAELYRLRFHACKGESCGECFRIGEIKHLLGRADEDQIPVRKSHGN